MRCPWSVWGWGGVPMNPLTILKPKSKGVSCPHCYISGLGCAFSLQFEHDIQTNDWAWFMDEKGKMREHFYLIFTTVHTITHKYHFLAMKPQSSCCCYHQVDLHFIALFPHCNTIRWFCFIFFPRFNKGNMKILFACFCQLSFYAVLHVGKGKDRNQFML
jgi:hypothetical protein